MRFIMGSETATTGPSCESCLSAECNAYCSLADRALVSLQESIVNGTVTFQQMKSLSCASRRLQVERLCAVNEEFSSLEVMKCSLTQRTAEHAAFMLHRTTLALMCQDIEAAKLQVEGSFDGTEEPVYNGHYISRSPTL